jgi:hypothetical protein
MHNTRSRSKPKLEARKVRAVEIKRSEPENELKILVVPPLYLGDFLVWKNQKWFVDAENLFRFVVYPHILAAEHYTRWISTGVHKYTCHVFDDGNEIDYGAHSGFQNVCILHAECQERNKRSNECPICFGRICYCSKIVRGKSIKELVLDERKRSFEVGLTSFFPETKNMMISEFWDLLFACLPKETHTLSQQHLLLAWWKLKRHGLFFLNEVYNPTVPKECKIVF